MPLSYLQAFEILDAVAQDVSNITLKDEEKVSLQDSIGRISTKDVRSFSLLPSFDSSAMDGYALNSELTLSASLEHPVIFRVGGTIAAGDRPLNAQKLCNDSLPFCVEIMTGAQFPVGESDELFDACLPVEHAQLLRTENKTGSFIKVTNPVRKNQHRRPAGSDVMRNDIVLKSGTLLNSQHIMALAALGIQEVSVLRQLRVGVCSTGSEIVPFDSKKCMPHQIRDANSPYIRHVLEKRGVAVTQFRIISDDKDMLEMMLHQFLCDKNDILVTTGGVSAGKYDLMRECIEARGATIHFHKVAVRPGHPILFATFDIDQPDCSDYGITKKLDHAGPRHRKVFFGLPGNPIAAAACLQFFVIPFLTRVSGEAHPMPVFATVAPSKQVSRPHACGNTSSSKRGPDMFRHGTLSLVNNRFEVAINEDQSSYKVSPIMTSNCWVWLPSAQPGTKLEETLPCFPFDKFPISNLASKSFSHLTSYHDEQRNHLDTEKQAKPLKVAILAGGLSTRMKTPKHLLDFQSGKLAYQSLLSEIHKTLPYVSNEDIYMSLRNEDQALELKQTHLIRTFSVFPHKIIIDTESDRPLSTVKDIGPAAGLLAAYAEDPTSDWLVVACDFPLLNQECLTQLLSEHRSLQHIDNDQNPAVTCFVNEDGYQEPLLAVWTPAALEVLLQNVKRGVRGPSRTIADFLGRGKAACIRPLKDCWIKNANTPMELEECLKMRDSVTSRY